MNLGHTIKRLITGPDAAPPPRLGRNDRCWCGSGRKYKACHLAADERKRATTRTAATQRGSASGF